MDAKKMLELFGNGDSILIPQYGLLSPGTLFESFENVLDWTVGDGTLAANTSEFRTGTQSIKFTSPVTNTVYADKTISQSFGAGGPNRLRISFYSHDPRDSMSTYGCVGIIFSSTADFSKYFSYDLIMSHVHPGWNTIDIYPENWTNVGTDSWSNTMIRLRMSSKPHSGNSISMSFDEILLNPVMISGVIFTFDGCYESQINVFNYMHPKKARGTLFVRPVALDNSGFLTLAQAHSMESAGWCVGIYPNNGYNLTLYTYEEVLSYITDTRNEAISNGFIKSNMHLAYPYGASNDDVIRAVTDAGCLTGCNTTGGYAPGYVSASFDQNYNLVRGPSLTVLNTLETVKGYIDTAYNTGRVLLLYGHYFDTVAAPSTWAISDFQALIDYIIAYGMPFLTISDLYALKNGPVQIKM